MVLTALVMMGEHSLPGDSMGNIVEAGTQPSATGQVQDNPRGDLPDASADPRHADSGIDSGSQLAATTPGIVETAWVMPTALTDAIATEGWRAYMRPPAGDGLPPAPATLAAPGPLPSSTSADPDVQVARNPSSAADLPRETTVRSDRDPAIPEPTPIPDVEAARTIAARARPTDSDLAVRGQSDSPGIASDSAIADVRPQEALIAPVPSPDSGAASPPTESAAVRSAASEPEELRALRSFRLNVPKELPKVDLAVRDGAAAPAVRSPAHAARTSPPIARSTATASARTTRSTGAASRPTPAEAPVPTEAQAAAASGQESLRRASEAVKRLSRRMGGGYVR